LGGKAGFPLYPSCSGCIFVGGTGASSVSLRPPTKISAAASPGCRSNPCRTVHRMAMGFSSGIILSCFNELLQKKIIRMKITKRINHSAIVVCKKLFGLWLNEKQSLLIENHGWFIAFDDSV